MPWGSVPSSQTSAFLCHNTRRAGVEVFLESSKISCVQEEGAVGKVGGTSPVCALGESGMRLDKIWRGFFLSPFLGIVSAVFESVWPAMVGRLRFKDNLLSESHRCVQRVPHSLQPSVLSAPPCICCRPLGRCSGHSPNCSRYI